MYVQYVLPPLGINRPPCNFTTTLSFQTINSLKLCYSLSLLRNCQARCNLTDAAFFPLAWSSVESSYNKHGLLLRYCKDFPPICRLRLLSSPRNTHYYYKISFLYTLTALDIFPVIRSSAQSRCLDACTRLSATKTTMNAQQTGPILMSNACKNTQMESPTSLLTPIFPTQFIHAFLQPIAEQGSCAWSIPAKDEQRKPIMEHVGEISGPLNIRI
jgi:hypothetical protein